MAGMRSLPWVTPFLCMSVCQAAGRQGGVPAEMVSPDGGEQWAVGSRHYVLWQAGADAAGMVKVEYTRDAGKTWQAVADAAPDTGRFLWKVPAGESKHCRIRVSDEKSGRRLASKAEFAITPSQEAHGYRWVNVTNNAAWAPRDGAGALVFAGKMWLLGGWNPPDKMHFPRICNNEVWSSEDGATWQLVKPNTFLDAGFDPTADWEGRHTAGYVLHDGKMWIVGGDCNQGHYQFDVWNTTDGAKWQLVDKGAKVPWGPRALHYTLAFGGRIWVMGGQTLPQFAPAAMAFYDDIWNSADGIHWTKVTPEGPHWCKRGMIGGSLVFRNRMWVLGGGTYDTPEFPERSFFNDVWSSADGVRWQQHVQCAPWEPRQYHDVAVFDGRMWVMEGWNKVNRNDVWYSADGVNWYELPGTPWHIRHAASAYVYKDALWMVAGNNMERDVWKLERAPAQGK